jgi:H+/Cl- antiporter ClcA
MLPLEKSWYQKLLVIALALGLAGGVSALLFMGITGIGIEFFFGDSGTEWWSGKWWWIPLTALGGLTVSILRKAWKIPGKVPGSIALAQQAWVDPASAPYLVIISTVSIITGASLGPSFALVLMGGGFGSWIVTRLGDKNNEEAKQEYTLTGMASGLGAAFSSPLFGTVLASELSPTSKRNYVAAFIPELIAATIGFIIFFGVTGSVMLGSYQLPEYEFSIGHLMVGALLGVLAAFILILFASIGKLINAISKMIANPYALGVIGGALVGLIAFALPLTATSGSSQLSTELQNSATISSGFIAAILIAKMIAIALSQSSGFLGGVVFPMIYIGGTAGLLVHSIFPDIPIELSVGAMLDAVPGAFLNAPLSLLMITAGTVGIGPQALIPIAIAVVTAHITLSLIRAYVAEERNIELQTKATD